MAKRVDPVTTEQKRNAARTTALRRLREAHRADWNRLLKAELDKVGVEWTPPPTEEEKAAQTVLELLEKFPDLRHRVANRKAQAILGELRGSPLDAVPVPPGEELTNAALRESSPGNPLVNPDPKLPADPVLGKDGPDPAEDVTRNDYA